MLDLKPYPKYRDSSVRWLGNMPEHWKLLPNRAIFSEVIERGYNTGQMLSVTITRGVIRQSDLLKDSSKKDSSNEDKSHYKLVQPGELAYNKMRAWQGAIGVSDFQGIVSPAYIVVRTRSKQNPRFFHYLFRTPAFAKEAERWSYGITSDMWSLRYEDFKQIYCVIPPLNEQNSIVRFLDYTDRRIRRYIRDKQKMVKLLNEQKQAIIHQAVTRGLDPNVRLKPSGVEWLGDVPEHWEVRKIGSIAIVRNGSTPSRNRPDYWRNGTIGWLSSGKVNDYIVQTPSEYITELAFKECPLSIIPKGSVILGMIGQGKTRGTSAFLDLDTCINQNLAAITPDRVLNGRFLHHFLTAFYKPVRDYGRGANQEALNCEIVRSIRITLPPIDEQNSIVEHITQSTSNIFSIEANIDKQIDALKEYRSRMFSDVVTGKIDVREAAAQLPEELEKLVEPEVEEAAAEEEELQEDVEQDIEEGKA